MFNTMQTLTVFEVDAIVSFKASFGLPVEEVELASSQAPPKKQGGAWDIFARDRTRPGRR